MIFCLELIYGVHILLRLCCFGEALNVKFCYASAYFKTRI